MAKPVSIDSDSGAQLELLGPARPRPRTKPLPRPRPVALPPPADLARPAAFNRELWFAVHLPVIAFEALKGEFTGQGPRAVLDASGRSPRVLLVDESARRAGIRPGLTLAAALALCSELETRVRDAARERAWLERAAALALRFTSRVSLEPPDGLLLEVRGSLRLFGGMGPLCRALETEFRAAGMHPISALAPTALSALACARSGRAARITSPSQLVGALAPLPLTVLRWEGETLARLASMGVRTIGEALRLPRAGFARRFGATQLVTLDRLAGRCADARRSFRASERFRGRFEPDHELESLDAVLASLEPLLADLGAFLEARQCGVTVIRCRLRHREAASTRIELRLATPEARAAQFARLLRERLGTLTLPAPVRRCELGTGPLVSRALASDALWQPGEHGGDGAGREGPAFIEQLRARLGREGVYCPQLRAEHRPELVARSGIPGGAPGAAVRSPAPARSAPWSAGRRPLWLLPAPQALEESGGQPLLGGALELVRGPERIESGWWDGADVVRDYYVARDVRGAWLWIFRERTAPHAWFLQGLFG